MHDDPSLENCLQSHSRGNMAVLHSRFWHHGAGARASESIMSKASEQGLGARRVLLLVRPICKYVADPGLLTFRLTPGSSLGFFFFFLSLFFEQGLPYLATW